MPPVPFLTLNGFPIRVSESGATRQRVTPGQLRRAYDGSGRPTFNAAASKWENACATIPLTADEVADMLAAAPHGTEVLASGRFVGDGEASPVSPLTMTVLYGAEAFRRVNRTDAKRAVPITLHES